MWLLAKHVAFAEKPESARCELGQISGTSKCTVDVLSVVMKRGRELVHMPESPDTRTLLEKMPETAIPDLRYESYDGRPCLVYMAGLGTKL